MKLKELAGEYNIPTSNDKKQNLFFSDKENYVNIRKDKKTFDLSNYSAKTKFYINSNALVAGKTKDETGGTLIKNVV